MRNVIINKITCISDNRKHDLMKASSETWLPRSRESDAAQYERRMNRLRLLCAGTGLRGRILTASITGASFALMSMCEKDLRFNGYAMVQSYAYEWSPKPMQTASSSRPRFRLIARTTVRSEAAV